MSPTESAAPGDFQRSTRMPLDAVVRLHFQGTVAYQNGFAANVSASGMFVKHPDPPELGTRLVFEFAIGSQRRPVQGTGEVVWRREKYEGPGRPAGAGIRFADIDELSKHHLAEALFEFLEASLGDRVTESEEVRGLVDSMPTHAPREFAAELEGRAPAAAVETPAEILPPIEPAAEPAPQLSPFRLFDDAPVAGSGNRFEASPPAATPAWPPAPYEPAAPVTKLAGAASARPEPSSSSALAIAAAVVALAALGFAGWWFWLRPPTSVTAAPAAPAATAPAPAAPSTPPLDARVDGGRTLADTVGKTTAAPDLPLPPAGTPSAGKPSAGKPSAGKPSAEPGEPVAATAPGAKPAPAEAAASARLISGLEAQADEAGTSVVIRGDGAFATGAFTWSQIGGDKPRVLVKLEGIEGPYRGTALGVPTAEVQSIRTGYHVKPGGNELHVVVDLVPGARVEVTTVEPVADRLVLRLARR